jgi:uncharacterized membrane protein YdjX (TVP38/TMEM64 family)
MIETLQNLLIEYPVIAPLIFIVFRMLPVLFPPIPGILIDALGISIFGWFWGFIYALIGLMISMMIAFYLGRIFREPLVRKFMPLKKMHEWENKFNENQKFTAILMIRIVTISFLDATSYVLGLTTISAFRYFIITFIVTAPSIFMIYYFGEIVVKNTWTIIIITTVLTFVLYYIFKLWKKYRKTT